MTLSKLCLVEENLDDEKDEIHINTSHLIVVRIIYKQRILLSRFSRAFVEENLE